MKNIREAITRDFLETVSFNEIAQSINSLSTEEKNQFAKLCRSGDSQLGNYLKGVCLEIAKVKSQARIDQITSDGQISVSELTKLLKYL